MRFARAAGLLLLLVSPAYAEQVQAVASDVTAITDGAGHVRVLFRAGPTQVLPDVAVRKATLRWTLPGGGAPERLRLEIHPVTTVWDPTTVTWTRGWTQPGGDFDRSLHARAELSLESSGEARFDLTGIFKEIMEQGTPSRGFILTVDPADGAGLPQADVARLGSLNTAALEVRYRTLPPIPRQRGLGKALPARHAGSLGS